MDRQADARRPAMSSDMNADKAIGVLDRAAPVYIAGHRGLVGSALVRKFQAAGFTNLLLRSRTDAPLELRDRRGLRLLDDFAGVFRQQKSREYRLDGGLFHLSNVELMTWVKYAELGLRRGRGIESRHSIPRVRVIVPRIVSAE